MKFLMVGVIILIISIFSSMIGIGGGVVYVPIFLLMGIELNKATLISLFLIFITSISSMIVYWRKSNIDWKLILLLFPLLSFFGFIGGFSAPFFSPLIRKVVLIFILWIASFFMWRGENIKIEFVNNIKGGTWSRKLGEYQYNIFLPFIIPITIVFGFLAGVLGIAGGVIQIPLMVIFCGIPLKIAISSSIVMILITSLSSLIGHCINKIDSFNIFYLILGIIPIIGGQIGSRISLSLNKEVLSKIFSLVLILMSIIIIFSILKVNH